MTKASTRASLAPVLLVNFVGTMGFTIVIPFLVFLVPTQLMRLASPKIEIKRMPVLIMSGSAPLPADVAKRLEDAEPLYQQALAIQREQLGARHPDVAETLYNFGHLLLATGRRDAAIRSFEEAAGIRESAFGASDPFAGEIRQFLARVAAGN